MPNASFPPAHPAFPLAVFPPAPPAPPGAAVAAPPVPLAPPPIPAAVLEDLQTQQAIETAIANSLLDMEKSGKLT